jgi:Outer membrane protein and related peptidoglycan-associated (lipo)proteins
MTGAVLCHRFNINHKQNTMVNKVRVYGKAQNRTALGIMHAYMVMYPQATMEDLEKAFPNELNPDSGVKKNFVKAGDKGTSANWDGFFQKEDELLTMGDGSQVAVVKMWTKSSFERLVSHAAQYGIEIAQFEEADGGGKKGSFRLEYLNGYIPPVAAAPRKSKAWLWILIIAIIAIAILAALLARSCNKEPQVKETIVEKVVHDTVYLQQIEEIEDNFNAAEFQKGKADLPEAAKFVLHDLAKVMEKNPQVKLRLEGHTSAEGDADFNQKLSEARAQAAVDFLINVEGVDESRLEAVGFGSTQLKNTDDPMAPENRRTEFIVVE